MMFLLGIERARKSGDFPWLSAKLTASVDERSQVRRAVVRALDDLIICPKDGLTILIELGPVRAVNFLQSPDGIETEHVGCAGGSDELIAERIQKVTSLVFGNRYDPSVTFKMVSQKAESNVSTINQVTGLIIERGNCIEHFCDFFEVATELSMAVFILWIRKSLGKPIIGFIE